MLTRLEELDTTALIEQLNKKKTEFEEACQKTMLHDEISQILNELKSLQQELNRRTIQNQL